MKAADPREKTVEELAELRKLLARDAFQNRLKNFTNRLDDTSSIRKAKRDLARILTTLRQREIAAAASAPAVVVAAAERSEPAELEAKAKAPKIKKAKAAAGLASAAEVPAAPKKSAKKREAKSQ